MGRLTNRNCLVTGAARGIGLAIADALVREGGNVAYVDVDPAVVRVAETVAERVRGDGAGRTVGLRGDVTKRTDIRAAVAGVVQAFGSLNVMFNNAGINRPLNFMDVTEENWDLILRVNALSVLLGTQEAARQMIAQGGGGKIINTASVASRQGYGNMAPYCASKAAVLSLTQAAARALAPHDITVNGFAPAVVLTPLWEQLDKDLVAIGTSKSAGEAINMFSAGILRGRAATPSDLTGTTTFLASADSDYITGQTIMVDGGKFPV
ncbi:MAG: SDR family oxidoreductase [Rhodospirillales bacterium]|nr:SDR family oxidoreductase [Rhodospirillales bacterium]